MPLSIVYILLWLEEMGFAVAAAGACPSTPTGTANKAANRKEVVLVTNAPYGWDYALPGIYAVSAKRFRGITQPELDSRNLVA
jgi:hypothetical protein